MSEYNPDQLCVGINEVIPDPIVAGPLLKDLIESLGTTEDDIDRLADEGSYRTALGLRGATDKDMDAVYRVISEESLNETSDVLESVSSVIAVRIAERALWMLNTEDEILGSNKIGGFKKALKTPHAVTLHTKYNSEDISRIADSQTSHIKNAELEFSKAFGRRQMVEGSVDPVEVKDKERMALNSLIDYINSPEVINGLTTQQRRNKLRKDWKKQL